jgi:hypothetical protein
MRRGHGDKLSRRQEQLIAALLVERSQGQAAAKVGVSEATAGRWVALPQFQEAFTKARRQALDRALSRVHQVVEKAVKVLETAMNGKDGKLRVRAALGILQHSLRIAEVIDVDRRLARLEELAEAAEQRDGGGTWNQQNAG